MSIQDIIIVTLAYADKKRKAHKYKFKDTMVATGNRRAKRKNGSNEVKIKPEKKYLLEYQALEETVKL